jgi:hypothetical protein
MALKHKAKKIDYSSKKVTELTQNLRGSVMNCLLVPPSLFLIFCSLFLIHSPTSHLDSSGQALRVLPSDRVIRAGLQGGQGRTPLRNLH